MLNRSAATVVLVISATMALTGCSRTDQPASAPPVDVLATVGGSAVMVTESDVRELLPAAASGPPVIIAGSPAPAPWTTALDQAIRDALLALEAKRLGLGPGDPSNVRDRAALARAIIERDRDGMTDLNAALISDAEASAWFTDNQRQFATIESAHVTWARFDDPAAASALLNDVKGMDQEGMLRAARARGATAGTATLDDAGKGADIFVARAAFALRERGAVGMVEGEAKTRWVVRIDRISMVSPRWDRQAAQRIKTAMAWQREQAHLDRLAEKLKARWAVVIYPDHVEDVRHPSLLPSK